MTEIEASDIVARCKALNEKITSLPIDTARVDGVTRTLLDAAIALDLSADTIVRVIRTAYTQALQDGIA
jgi:hypothetical protein